MSKIFDSHAHYDDEAFDIDREQLLNSLPKNNICAVVNCATNLKTAEMTLRLSEKYDYIYAALGIYPHEATNINEDTYQKLSLLLDSPRVVAVGEIGLDYHYDGCPKEKQIQAFKKQLSIAKQKNLPVIIHDREAHGDMYPILKEYCPCGVIHCFSGSVELAREALSYGMYIGFGGAVTFKKAKTPIEVAAYVPDDRLLVETDAPYMTPVPFRGKRCNSTYIKYTAQKLAEIRHTTLDEILKITSENAFRLFGIHNI